jgi:hypothetical protein
MEAKPFADLPSRPAGRMAIARKHWEADAVYLIGWIGFPG